MTHEIITSTVVSESERLGLVDGLFGIAYVMRFEPTVFNIAETLAPDYTGGYWEFYDLSNGGFYMAPRLDPTIQVESMNGYEGQMSPDAFGITVCLYAFSELSFGNDGLSRTCANQYHLLRDFAAAHAEAKKIWKATD